MPISVRWGSFQELLAVEMGTWQNYEFRADGLQQRDQRGGKSKLALELNTSKWDVPEIRGI